MRLSLLMDGFDLNNGPPAVSVVIPCYNQGHFLSESVQSVLEQTYSNLEIIVVNGGSTDPKTNSILSTFERPKTMILHTENKGPSWARNFGIQQAQGTYILPLDADDKIAPSYIEKALYVLETQPDVGIVYCEAALFGKKNKPWRLPAYHFPAILLDNVIFCSGLFRRADWEAVGGYNINMEKGCEDYDFWLSLIALGCGVYRIPETLFFYRKTGHSRSDQMTMEDTIACYAQLFRNHPDLYQQHIDVLFREILTLRQRIKQLKSPWKRWF